MRPSFRPSDFRIFLSTCLWAVLVSRGRSCLERRDSGYLRIDCEGNESLPSSVSGDHRRLDLANAELDRAPDDFFGKIDPVRLRLFAFEVYDDFRPRTKGALRSLEVYDTRSVFSWTFSPRHLANLTHLVLDNAGVYFAGEELNQLTSLRFLEVRDSSLAWTSPDGFANLKELRLLCLSGNLLKTFRRNYLPNPAPHLWHLDLSFNRIVELPADFSVGLPRLRELKLDHNRLRRLPDETAPLCHLRELWIHGNPLCEEKEVKDQSQCYPPDSLCSFCQK
ncbi:chondroadherin-like protein [Centruroides sculpturatus]|uniref:chondroadherin-like protein n=1 Tax=Centruroides sculpturatus TaxID=218467 RepID=UPI000C6EAFBE|nr:chondroadherin-like protein [Centruroides sculpturatus]